MGAAVPTVNTTRPMPFGCVVSGELFLRSHGSA